MVCCRKEEKNQQKTSSKKNSICSTQCTQLKIERKGKKTYGLSSALHKLIPGYILVSTVTDIP